MKFRKFQKSNKVTNKTDRVKFLQSKIQKEKKKYLHCIFKEIPAYFNK